MASNCIVCNVITNKYKCPKCLSPYCSLNCFKEHQKAECKPVDKPSSDPNEDNDPTIFLPFRTDDTVDPVKLEELRTSDGLKNLLYNPHLRMLIQEIDVAPNAWNAMRAAMHEPLFIEFADECLKVVEPPPPTDE